MQQAARNACQELPLVFAATFRVEHMQQAKTGH
jgi:hypothetical protein